MTHTHAKVLAKLLIDLTMGSVPSANEDWPVYAENEPPAPDNTVTTFMTRDEGGFRVMFTGEFVGPRGVQVRVRGKDNQIAWTKVDAIATALAGVLRRSVTIDSSTYQVHCLSAITNPIPLGKEVPTSKRTLYTLNMTMSVVQCT